MERKAVQTEYKLSPDGRTVEGYASTFGNVDRVSDMVLPGAFKKTISDRQSGGIKLMRDHKDPIGLAVAAEDSRGLYTKSRISEIVLGNETLTLLRDGVLDRMSMGYIARAKEYGQKDGQQVRYLKEIQLEEVSIVTFPANEMAMVTAVKSIEDLDRAFHEFKAGRLTADDMVALIEKAATPETAPLADHGSPADHQPDTSDSAACEALDRLTRDIRSHIRRAA